MTPHQQRRRSRKAQRHQTRQIYRRIRRGYAKWKKVNPIPKLFPAHCTDGPCVNTESFCYCGAKRHIVSLGGGVVAHYALSHMVVEGNTVHHYFDFLYSR
jgi:hypothetical protein